MLFVVKVNCDVSLNGDVSLETCSQALAHVVLLHDAACSVQLALLLLNMPNVASYDAMRYACLGAGLAYFAIKLPR